MIFLDLEVVADALFKGIIISSKSSSINLLFMSGQKRVLLRNISILFYFLGCTEPNRIGGGREARTCGDNGSRRKPISGKDSNSAGIVSAGQYNCDIHERLLM